MKGKLEKEGKYELFETTHGHQILSLNDKNWFAIVEGQKGKIIVKSDADHEKKKTLQSGEFYLADFENDPEFRDMPHLFLQEGNEFREYILPNDLAGNDDKQKKLIVVEEKLPRKKVLEHLKGKGDKGNEKQAQKSSEKSDNKIDNMNKQELYELAKERQVSGRSKMGKEELLQALKK